MCCRAAQRGSYLFPYLLITKEEIPEIWRASVLGQVTGPIATHPPYDPSTVPPATKTPLGGALGQGTAEMCIFETNEYDSERDYCIPEDETLASGWVYVSLVNNPERFTGYIGDHANAIWKEIYRENCFSVQPHHPQEDKYKMQSEWAKSDLEAVILGRNKARGNLDEDFNQLALETCLEKRVFWRIMSGMHTSISTHLCWDYLNQTTGQWVL
jgi:ERO1-like protein beta